MTIKSTGFESSFIKSWGGWENPINYVMQFSDVELRDDVFDQETIDRCEDVTFDLETGITELYDGENDEPFKKVKFGLKLLDESLPV